MRIKPVYIFSVLCIAFLVYSVCIYIQPLYIEKSVDFNVKKASDGRLVWQNNNCQSCHQLYGLGGYLGPDLTNIYSDPAKGEIVIRSLVKSGVKQMPEFKLNDAEMENLVEFLKSVDASGTADPRKFKIMNDGMVTQNEKK